MADDPPAARPVDGEPPAAEGAPVDAGPAPLSLVYLDVDDEITSAASRIRAAGAEEIALVLPFGSRLATSRINFRLLAREAGERGKRLQIITADASARSLAAAAGLPIHASVAAFESHRKGGDPGTGAANGTGAATVTRDGSAGPARAVGVAAASAETGEQLALPSPDLDDTATRVLTVPRRKPPSVPLVGPPRPPVRTGVAIGVGLAVIVTVIAAGLLALEFLPSATITLNPRSQPLGPIELTVEAREDVTAPDQAGLLIPAERFTFALEATQTFPATGVKRTETKATGSVTFSNFDTGRGVVVPAGTIVRTEDKIEFVTLADVTLPRAQIDFFPPFPVKPSTANVGIEAAEPGPEGNVGNNAIVEVRGGGRNLLVTNERPTSGGERTESPEVSEADVESAMTALQTALLARLDELVAAREGVPAEVMLFPATRVAGEPSWSVEPESLVGTQAAEFDLGASAEGSALGVDPAPIEALARTRLEARVTDGWSVVPASITVDVGAPNDLAGIILYPVTAAGTEVREIDVAALRAEILGLGLPEARALLDDFGDVAIEVWPDWVTTIPTRADRVTLTLGEPRPSAPPT